MSIWQKITVVLLGVAILGSVIYFMLAISRPPAFRHFESIPWVTYVHPNVRKLKRARALVHDGKLREARVLIVNALISAPKSPVTRQLRDLLGDINTQIFFSNEPSPRKIEYTVRMGDALSSIARRLKSSAAAIMRVNKLDSTLIRPGEKLFVPALDFTITIDLPRDRVVVHDSHGFFTQYPITSADLPPSRKPMVETKVKAESFWKNGRPVAQDLASSKDDATPRIHLSHFGYVLYGVEETSEDSDSKIDIEDKNSNAARDQSEIKRPPQGIAMLKEDIAELELLIGKGTPVTIILDQKQ
jgi:LysM repeat protein